MIANAMTEWDPNRIRAHFIAPEGDGRGSPSLAGSQRLGAAVIRVYDDAGNVIETHEQAGDFKESENDLATGHLLNGQEKSLDIFDVVRVKDTCSTWAQAK
jgi:hypothetical protein